MRVAPLPPWIQAACVVAVAAFLVQLFVLGEPAAVERLKSLTWDKLMHAIAFGGFAALLWAGLGCDAPFLTWTLVVATGVADEIHQVYVPGRHADVLDAVADAVGAGLVVFALHRLAIRRQPCVESWARSRAATSSPSSSRA